MCFWREHGAHDARVQRPMCTLMCLKGCLTRICNARGGAKGGKKMGGGQKVVIEQHRHAGVFIARGKEDALVTRNLVPGVSVYGEKRIATEVPKADGEGTDKVGFWGVESTKRESSNKRSPPSPF